LKGKVGDFLPDLDEETLMGGTEDTKVSTNKLVIAGLGALKRREKGYVLPNVKKL